MPIASEFLKPNDPILLQKAAEVPQDEIDSEETRSNIKRLISIAEAHQVDKTQPIVVGLAAPQIGISRRIILVDLIANGKGACGDPKVYINPKIVWSSEEEAEWYEGCWSSDKVCGIVSRPVSIKVNAYSPEGKLIDETHNGYTARIFQHEADHLEGREFVDKITDPAKLHWVDDEDWVEYRDNGGWRNWPKKCTRERWEEIKGKQDSPPSE